LLVYDILAGVKKSERRKMLSKEKTAKNEPLLGTEKLLAGGLYYEYRTDDARLVIELAKSANEQGAKLLNYCSADNFIYDENGKVKGVSATDEINGKKVEIYAKTIVNACGPSVDILRKADQSLYGKRLQLTKGVHLVFPYAKVPLQQSVYFDVPDGRMIFAIPRDGITYIGTTDTVYNQDIDHPRISQDDVTYILNAVNNMFPTLNLQKSDVQSGWAGLRPLIYEDGKSPSELSRKDEIITSESGLVSIAGGKLTGYRLMAEKIAAIAQANSTQVVKKRSTTDKFKLSGCNFESEESMKQAIKNIAASSKMDETQIAKWVYKYGSNTPNVIANYQTLKSKYAAEIAFLLAELQYCIENEMVCSINDFAIRRSGMLFFNIPTLVKYQNELLQFMQEYFAWNEEKLNVEKAALNVALEEATVFI
ncbi:MAG TPA: glycerol-3-phosphate dehydrogenase/oxidase, partial [Chitinophagales bacterium]